MVPFEHLGPYRIGEPIGRGGMGSVYKATHEKTGEHVAVKVIAASVSDDIRFRRRFSTEIETLKKLKHPNIVSLIGHGEQHGQLFYSMELVEGESLQQRLKRDRRMPWRTLLDLSIDICNALKHAHNFGVVHRDLKPANLLITPDGTPKLVDFGIAKLFGNSEHTAVGAVLGTADFMAPEQACDGPISPRTDLYALGNVMYACLAGRPPFSGRTMNRIIEALQREEPAPLDMFAPDVPDEIITLIHDLLEKDPNRRPPTALAVMNRMKAIRAGLDKQMSQQTAVRIADNPTQIQDKPSIANASTQAEASLPQSPTIDSANLQPGGDSISRHDLTIEASVAEVQSSVQSTEVDDDFAITGVAPKAGNERIQRDQAKSTERAQSKPGSMHTHSTLVPEEPIERATHFNTVADNERRRGSWESPEHTPHANHLWHVVSIVGMISVLLGAAGLFWWAMQKPSADQLYAMILASQDSDDAVKMRAQIDQFKRLYPSDDRAEELIPMLQEQDSYRVMRRLRLASVRQGGDENLQAHEQVFLEAMRDVDRDPAKAHATLRHWLDVYDPDSDGRSYPSSSEMDYMIRAANQELKRLSATSYPPGDARADELIDRIRWADTSLDPVAQKKLFDGMVALYQDKAWAQPALRMARDRLSKLDVAKKESD